jgi:hypothetical protein
VTVELRPDGKLRTYRADLASAPEYRGLITGIALETIDLPRVGEQMTIKSIVFPAK